MRSKAEALTRHEVGGMVIGGQPITDAVWGQHGVSYQIYRRSFQDSNGDGNGTCAVPGNHTASQNHRQASMS